MSGVRPLPWLRLFLYVVIFGVCGGVATYEGYCAAVGEITTGTVLRVITSRSVGRRNTQYWAEYEYFDALNGRHIGKARVVPATNPGDVVEVQYNRFFPEQSRLAPSPAAGICFGSVAALALVVFVGEFVVRFRRARKRSDLWVLANP